MNIDRLVCVGISHQTAPVALREKLSNWPLADLRTACIEELVVLSTCNRLELYAYLAETPPSMAMTVQPLIDLICATQAVAAARFTPHLYQYTGEAATAHLCRVAAGMESMVLGEGQILGQVNAALQHAYQVKSVGPALALLFRTAITTGKRARTETKISVSPVSISSAAIALAAELTGNLRQQHVAVVGLGEMGQLALKGLHGRGVKALSLVNRTLARAQTMQTIFGGAAYNLDDLPTVLEQADVVIMATSATKPLLEVATVQQALAARAGRPLTLIDLAVPRNIEPAVALLPLVTVRDVDDMRAVVDDAHLARQAELPQVEAIVEEQLAAWRHEVRVLQLRPVVVGLRQQAEQARRRAVATSLHHLAREQGAVDAASAQQLERLSRALVNQLLHQPTVKLKQKAGQPDDLTYAALVCDLFGLDVPLPTEEPASNAAWWVLSCQEEIDQAEINQEDVDDVDVEALGEGYFPCPSGGAGFCTAHAPGFYCLPATTEAAPQYELVGQP
jgi:glutamyl-tRNA reductase